MTNFSTILFDLDGTLSDPKEGIIHSIQYALQAMGIIEEDISKLESFIGPPLHDSFSQFYGFNQEQIQMAIAYYRENFKKTGMYENQLYQGIPDLLENVKKQGKQIIIATSKPTVFAIEILNYFNIHSYFDDVVGSNLDGTRSSKAEIIKHILITHNLLHKQEVVMIGDRKYDIIGANQNQIASMGVTYGFGTLKELESVSPSYIVNSINELRNVLTGI